MFGYELIAKDFYSLPSARRGFGSGVAVPFSLRRPLVVWALSGRIYPGRCSGVIRQSHWGFSAEVASRGLN
jgi:hypothetical protein